MSLQVVSNSSSWVPQGYWRPSINSPLVLCPYPQACHGGNSSGDSLCTIGYEGALCGVAKENNEFIDWTSRDLESCSLEIISLSVILPLITVLTLTYVSCCMSSSQNHIQHDHNSHDTSSSKCIMLWKRLMGKQSHCDTSEVNDEVSIEEEEGRSYSSASSSSSLSSSLSQSHPFDANGDMIVPPPLPSSCCLSWSQWLSVPPTESHFLSKRALRKMQHLHQQEKSIRQQLQHHENQQHHIYIWISRLKTLYFTLQV